MADSEMIRKSIRLAWRIFKLEKEVLQINYVHRDIGNSLKVLHLDTAEI